MLEKKRKPQKKFNFKGRLHKDVRQKTFKFNKRIVRSISDDAKAIYNNP